MMEIEQKIEQEVIDLHNLFVNWFTGSFDKKDLEPKLASRFYEKTLFITTKGATVPYEHLMTMFNNGYKKRNSDFKIAISNVEVRHEIGAYFLVNYIEWQTTDPDPQSSGIYNARKTTALISKEPPFKWLHIHETMLEKPSDLIEDWKA